MGVHNCTILRRATGSPGNRPVPETNSAIAGYLAVESFNQGAPRMTNQNQNNPNQKPGQQNQTPGQKPGQQQGGGQKPGQQQQDPNRQDQNPGQQNPGQRTDR
jgi:type VI secretion system secreted protein VgrG